MTEQERFWSKVFKTDTCWMWAGAEFTTGYGMFTKNRKPYKAHRYAYEISVGPVPEGVCVCHSCDERLCVNPSHLWLGTFSENTQDMYDKGRAGSGRLPKGEKHPKAKLTVEKVARMRDQYKTGEFSQQDLATEYGVSKSAIKHVLRGRTWS